MKRLGILLIIMCINVSASERLGIGVSIGSPIGLHYFYNLENNKRIEGVIGASITGSGGFIDSQYVTTKKNYTKLQAYELDLNYGYGLRAHTGDKSKLGPSALLGVDHQIEGTKFSVLANSGAAFLVGNGLTLDLNLYLGANYNF
jgi:hypothetical protein